MNEHYPPYYHMSTPLYSTSMSNHLLYDSSPLTHSMQNSSGLMLSSRGHPTNLCSLLSPHVTTQITITPYSSKISTHSHIYSSSQNFHPIYIYI